MPDKYLKSFSRLRTDKNRKRWSALTTHHAPHKPFLLLSIMDLIAQGTINNNFIEPSFELVETWNGYRNAFMPIGHCTGGRFTESRCNFNKWAGNKSSGKGLSKSEKTKKGMNIHDH